jgi:hypothetical protein
MKLRRLVLAAGVLALLVCLGTFATAGPNVLTTIPESPNPDSRYVFYLHGKIIEDSGRRPEHPRFGTYEYDAILEALEKRGYLVISEKRKPSTKVGAYAQKTAEQIEELLSKGVPPDRITVVGFSKGGRIVQAVSAELKPPIRYVMLASCPRLGGGPRLHGRVLAIREESDLSVGSCRALFDRSPGVLEHRELVTKLGGGHGAFYKPQEAWLVAVGEWIEK